LVQLYKKSMFKKITILHTAKLYTFCILYAKYIHCRSTPHAQQ